MNEFHEIHPMSRLDAERAFRSGDAAAVSEALVRLAFHNPDWAWVESKCLAYCEAPDADVRGVAVTCLGHLARLHRRLHLDHVMPVLTRLRSDPDVAGRVNDALDDIRTFLAE